MISLPLLLSPVIGLIIGSNVVHRLIFLPEVERSVENEKGLLEHFGLLVAHHGGLFHAPVQYILYLGHHEHFSVAYGVLVLSHAQQANLKDLNHMSLKVFRFLIHLIITDC